MARRCYSFVDTRNPFNSPNASFSVLNTVICHGKKAMGCNMYHVKGTYVGKVEVPHGSWSWPRGSSNRRHKLRQANHGSAWGVPMNGVSCVQASNPTACVLGLESKDCEASTRTARVPASSPKPPTQRRVPTVLCVNSKVESQKMEGLGMVMKFYFPA